MPLATCAIGFPRIGPDREAKKSLEKFWKGQSSEEELRQVQQAVEQHAWQAHKDAGISIVGVDSTLYDHVLDMTCTLGLVPARFQGLQGLQRYFAMARGKEGVPALDMSKFLNTNYHYLVPEIDAKLQPKLDSATLVATMKRAQAALGAGAAAPMIVGPVTMARLAELDGIEVAAVVQKLVPLYTELLQQLADLKVPEVQVLEPTLCVDAGEDSASMRSLYEETFQALAQAKSKPPLNLVTYYDDLGANYEWVVQLPVQAVSLDFCGVAGAADPCQTLALLQKHGFPTDKVLGAGIIDGRNVWADTGTAATLLADVRAATKATVRVQPSCSLQHVPLDAERETKLPEKLRARLAFALQKLQELRTLAANPGAAAGSKAPVPARSAGSQASNVDSAMLQRSVGYDERRAAQFKAVPQMPAFPTTTIGSFPQTGAIRAARAAAKAGKISPDEQQRRMDAFISQIVGVQEGLGLDVLVHGEPERSDMVEFFGESLEGFAFTAHGWVQSYGSRYVRPPLIHSDVSRPHAMTVREFAFAQSLTDKPVKGMLTGPVTMLNWAFPRVDIKRSEIAQQLAQAVRQEVADLEAAGCKIVQVDEPALREGLPLKRGQWQAYLKWAVDAFRLATAGAAPETQVVTHLCYSDFDDILPAIEGLGADVLTIENARSGDAMLRALSASGYVRDVGAGVYDVHSPVVPSADFMRGKVESALAAKVAGADPRKVWLNPDCGLKTRGWPEVLPALRNMVTAAEQLRAQHACA